MAAAAVPLINVQISVTDSNSGSTVLLNTKQIVELVDNGSGTDILFEKNPGYGASITKISVDESVSTVKSSGANDLISLYTVQYPTTVSAWITFDNLVGTFTVGEIVLINNKVRAQVVDVAGAVLKVTNVTVGGAISDNDTIVGQSNGATADVDIAGSSVAPATDNVAAADKYTYSSGVTVRNLNRTRINGVSGIGVGDINNISYLNSGKTQAIYSIDAITGNPSIQKFVNAAISFSGI